MLFSRKHALVISPWSNYGVLSICSLEVVDLQYFTDYQEAFTVPGDMTSRGAHFYEEAKRLLEIEAGRISIPTLQGMVTLSV